MSKGYFTEVTTQSGIEVVTLGFGDTISAKIAPVEGNNLFGLRCKDVDIIHYDDTLPLADFLTGTPILFPFPNRVEDAMWEWRADKHLQKKDGVPVCLHSLVYDEKSWTFEPPEALEDGAALRTRLEVDEAHPIHRGYPFCFALGIEYLLCETGLKISYEVENRSDMAMPYGFALHPYFKRIGQTKICVPAKYAYERRKDNDPEFLGKLNGGYAMIPNILPTGKLLEAAGTPLDLNSPIDVNSLDLDDVYTGLKGDVTIDYPSEKLKVSISATKEMRHAVVYTPQEQSFFCIEPQTCATDAVNLYARGIDHANLLVLEPGQSRGGAVTLSPAFY